MLTVTFQSCLQGLLLGKLGDVNLVVSQLKPLEVFHTPCLVWPVDQSLCRTSTISARKQINTAASVFTCPALGVCSGAAWEMHISAHPVLVNNVGDNVQLSILFAVVDNDNPANLNIPSERHGCT